MEQRTRVIDLTNSIGVVIFVVVHLVLATGLYMSWREFQRAALISKGVKTQEQDTELKLSLEGLALKTSLHGVLLLGFALAFYFLYLKFVYPVSVVPS